MLNQAKERTLGTTLEKKVFEERKGTPVRKFKLLGGDAVFRAAKSSPPPATHVADTATSVNGPFALDRGWV